MIQYALKCADGHRFDSWFQSAAAFDKLQSAGLVSCALCGQASVEKVLMAPAVRPAGKSSEAAPAPQAGALSTPATPEEQKLADFRRKVEATSDYVGKDFVTQARAMHDGAQPEKSIYGEARLDEARKLIEDGIPVLPLPFRTSRKDN